MLANQSRATESAAFHPHGPLPPEAAHLYVLRQADARLETLIRQRGVIALAGPRLSGKSSMLLRQWALLGASPRWLPVYCALGDLAALDEPAWYAALLNRLARPIGLSLPPLDPALPPAQSWLAALHTALSRLPRGKTLVLLLDDAETIPPAISAGFFAALCELAERRATGAMPDRLSLVLAGAFAPGMDDGPASQFDDAETVYITDASLEALTYLIAQLGTDTRQIASDVPERIYEWTEGDVALTHTLCAGLANDVPEGVLLFEDVDRAVRRHLFAGERFARLWQAIESDPEVSTLIDTLLDHNETLRFTLDDPAIRRAWLAGAVRADPLGNCALRSLVYESVLFALRRNEALERGPWVTAPDDERVLRGRYRLDHVVHPGKLSYLFRGTDLRTGEMVAIKQLTVSRDVDEIAWQRFQREAEALKGLDHPNIVRLRDTFRDGDFEYIVMEYIYGGSLFDRLKREGRLPLHEALAIAMQLAGALDHAHARGIIHRDVKPSNVMMAGDCMPRLADFGVARLLSASGVTRPRTRIGTAPYLSPEACLGEPIDARGDIWSLGIVLYEMLAGSVPFTGRTDMRIARAILNDPLPDLRAVRPDAPDALIALLESMLAKDPAERIPSARLIAERLRQISGEQQ